jgi:hypothetical protein
MIAVPSNAGTPDYSTAMSIATAQMEAAQRGWMADTVYRVKDSMITRARNVLFTLFLQSECTDLFFIDDDIGCQPGSFGRLMDHPVEIVGGSYRSRRGDIEEFVLKPLPGDGLCFDPDQKTGLMEVEAVPTGFMRITRAAALRMVEAYPDLWFYDSTAPGMKIHCLFDFALDQENHMYWSEDYYFCRRWRAIGGKVWVDPFLELTHTGKDAFKGNLLDWLKRRNAEHQAAQPQQTVVSLADAAKAAMVEDAA